MLGRYHRVGWPVPPLSRELLRRSGAEHGVVRRLVEDGRLVATRYGDPTF